MANVKPFFILLISLILFSASRSVANDKHLALGVENIRVLLFEQYQTEKLVLFAYNEIITLQSDNFNVKIYPGDTGIELYVKDDKIVFDRDGIIEPSPVWNIETTGNALIRLLHDKLGWRYYKGSMQLTVDGQNIRAINTVGLEDYVASVVGSEMNFDNAEALKVQSVISRTYALWNISLYQQNEYELNDHILNQVYKGELIFKPQYRRAAESTSGEVLLWSNKLIMAVYHSTCGGRTTSNNSVWAGKVLPYLTGIDDNGSCEASPHRDWTFTANADELYTIIKPENIDSIDSIEISEWDEYERVTKMVLHSNGNKHEMTVNNFRLAVNRHFGSLTLKSSFFTMKMFEDSYIFTGHGFGHGVGLCQWGALGLAESGWNYQDILRFYYSGVEITDYTGLKGDILFLARF